ncbi:hypothetical protein QEN19_003107 [Hanseniaspora menglaensis]
MIKNQQLAWLIHINTKKAISFLLSLVVFLSLLCIYDYKKITTNTILEATLDDYRADEINPEHLKYIKDPQMLQLLGYYDSSNIIPTADKHSLYSESNNRYFDIDWKENLISTEYDYPLKLPAIIYSNKEIINSKTISNQNCIMLLLSEQAAVKKTIRTIQSMIDNAPNMVQYPFYLITGFYLSDVNLLEIFKHFEKYDIEINIIKTTEIIVDSRMCGESIDYLFSGISDIKEPRLKDNKNARFNNDFETNYPLSMYKNDKKWKRIKNSNSGYMYRILEEYGTASLDFNKLTSYDVYQFGCFSRFENFMSIKPGMIFSKLTHTDLFLNMNNESSNEDVLVKFTNFRYSQKYRNANHYEVLEKIYDDLNLLIDPIFSNNEYESIWKQLLSYAMKNIDMYNEVKKRIHEVVLRLKKTEIENNNLFNGILLDTQDSIFISKFNIFRSLEYELFFKNFLLMSSINDDSWIPNDPITLFLGLINRHADNDNKFYRDDFELLDSIDIMFDCTGDHGFDNLIHWNIRSINEYINKNNLEFEFDLSTYIKENTLLAKKREENNDDSSSSSALSKLANKESNIDTTFHVDQRLFSKYSFEDKVFFFKNHELFDFLKGHFTNKYAGTLSKDEIEELLNLFMYDNLDKMNKMFNFA